MPAKDFPLEALLTWAVVVEQGGVGRAAEQLGISQPAVTARLRRLAEAAGGPLFVRTRKGLEPTATGARLLPLARALGRILELATKGEAKIRIAASQTAAAFHLPPRLARVPALGFELVPTNSQEALSRVREGRAELAVIEGPPPLEGEDLTLYPFARDELVLVAPRDHPLAGKRVSPSALEKVPLLMREPGSGTREVVEAALASHGVRPPVKAVVAGLLPLKEAVKAGIGPAFLPRVAVRRELRSGEVRRVQLLRLRLTRPLTLVLPSHADEASRALAKALLVS